MALIYAVEDDKNILEIEMFALKNSGYQVDGFECARDFYKKLDEKQPDLILLDVMLPDEDGLEIVAKLRRRPETKKIPVIMVTAKTTEIDKVKPGRGRRRLPDEAVRGHGADRPSEGGAAQDHGGGEIPVPRGYFPG